MSTNLETVIEHARTNPIEPKGRNSISRFAALLTDGRRSFVGFNSYLTHPLQAKFAVNEKSVHLHAEIAAIIEAIRWHSKQSGSHYADVTDLSQYDLYVARVLKDGTPASARPCAGCQRALIHFNIKNVEWTQ